MPGSLIPTWAKKDAEQALTPGRMTPARYRFDAAATDNTDQVTPNMVLCPHIRARYGYRTSLVFMHERPMARAEVLSLQSKLLH